MLLEKSHEMFLQKVNKLAFNVFDDKRKYLNSIENEPWSHLNFSKLQSPLRLPSTKDNQNHIYQYQMPNTNTGMLRYTLAYT